MKGDVIVEIAGQTIANIYDYTYALELLKADSRSRSSTCAAPSGARRS